MALWTANVTVPAGFAVTCGVAIGDNIWLITDDRDDWEDVNDLTIHVYDPESLTVEKLNYVFPLVSADIWCCQSQDKVIYFACMPEYRHTDTDNQFFKLDTTTMRWEFITNIRGDYNEFTINGSKIFLLNRNCEVPLKITMIDMETKIIEVFDWTPKNGIYQKENNLGFAFVDNQLHMVEHCSETKIITVYDMPNGRIKLHEGDHQQMLQNLAETTIGYFEDDPTLLNDDEDVEPRFVKLNFEEGRQETIDLSSVFCSNVVEPRMPCISNSNYLNGLIHVVQGYYNDEVLVRTIDCKPSLATICYAGLIESILLKERKLEDVLKSIPIGRRKRFENMLKWKEEQEDAYDERRLMMLDDLQ